jgi:hypothetical protein
MRTLPSRLAGMLAVTAVVMESGCSTSRPPEIHPGPFVGQYFQHAGSLSIAPDGRIDLVYQVLASGSPAVFPHVTLHITGWIAIAPRPS